VRGGRRSPPTGVIDAQSVDGGDAAGLKTRKYDGGKRRDGRKRHTLTDTGGLLLEVAVTPANTHDCRAAPEVLDRVMEEPGRLLEVVCAGTSYQGEALAEAFSEHGVEVEVVRRPDGRASPSSPAGGWSSARWAGCRGPAASTVTTNDGPITTNIWCGGPDHADPLPGPRTDPLARVARAPLDPKQA
jgi:IS5 family transposase